MKTSRWALQGVASQSGEVLAYGFGLLIPLWASRNLSFSAWQGILVLGAAYLVIGMMPVPWERRVGLVAIAAFLVPLVILGCISWRIEYFLIFERSGAWENLPRILLSLENFAAAIILCGCAVVGTAPGRKVGASALRRTTR